MYKHVRLLIKRLYPFAHRHLSGCFPQALWRGSSTQPNIALTFDDGPHSQDTPQLLEILAGYSVSVTFFFLGNRLLAHQDLVRQVYHAGHQIGLHGYRHRPFILEKNTTLQIHLQRSQELLVDACRAAPANFRDVRPPYGWFTPATLRLVSSWGYRPVMWSLVPPHWLQPGAATIRQVTEQTQNGSILVLHEDKAGPSVANLVHEVIPTLLTEGFSFVTVDRLWPTPPGSGQ